MNKVVLSSLGLSLLLFFIVMWLFEGQQPTYLLFGAAGIGFLVASFLWAKTEEDEGGKE